MKDYGNTWKETKKFIKSTYTTLGHPSFPKERIEIFTDGTVILIDDFKKLIVRGGGYKKRQDIKLRRADKGHHNELLELLKALKGEEPLPVTIEDGIRATTCSLMALENLRSGKTQYFNQEGG